MLTSEIWWKQVTGPVRLTEQIAKALTNEQSVWFIIPFDLPWRKDLRYCVEYLISGESIDFEFIDFEDEFNGNNIGKFILERYGSEEEKASFRPHKDTIENYIQERGIINNKVIWVKGIPDEHVIMWLNFLRQIKGTKRSNGQFVIETKKSGIQFRLPSYLVSIDYFDYVSKDDSYLFASILSSKSKSEKYLHQYITHVASSICDFDSEVLADYIENTDFKCECPLTRFKELYDNTYREIGRGVRLDKDHIHPFYLIRHNMDLDLQNRVWIAQLRVIFPLIEQERINFIKKYYDEVNNCLPIEQFDEMITNPYDVEISTLTFLLNNNYLRVLLEDRNQIFFMREIRNKLAHRCVCTVDEVNIVLKMIYNN